MLAWLQRQSLEQLITIFYRIFVLSMVACTAEIVGGSYWIFHLQWNATLIQSVLWTALTMVIVGAVDLIIAFMGISAVQVSQRVKLNAIRRFGELAIRRFSERATAGVGMLSWLMSTLDAFSNTRTHQPHHLQYLHDIR